MTLKKIVYFHKTEKKMITPKANAETTKAFF